MYGHVSPDLPLADGSSNLVQGGDCLALTTRFGRRHQVEGTGQDVEGDHSDYVGDLAVGVAQGLEFLNLGSGDLDRLVYTCTP